MMSDEVKPISIQQARKNITAGYAEDVLLTGKKGICLFVAASQYILKNHSNNKNNSVQVNGMNISLISADQQECKIQQHITNNLKRMIMLAGSISQDFDDLWNHSGVLKHLYSYVYVRLKRGSSVGKTIDPQKFIRDFITYLNDVHGDRQKQQLKLLISSVQTFRQNLEKLIIRYSIALEIKAHILGILSGQNRLENTRYNNGGQYMVFTRKPGLEPRIVVQNRKLNKLQKLVTEKFKNKMKFYNRFVNKASSILSQSKKKLDNNDNKGFIMLQGLCVKFNKQNKYTKILQSYNQDKRKTLWEQINKQFNFKKRNITQVVKLMNVTAQSIKNSQLGVNQLLNKNWTPNNQNVKPIFEKLNQFNKKFVSYITGIFMSSNFILNWQRTKMILRKAAKQVSNDNKQTTAQNILNQIYQKIAQQGQLDSPTERMTKLKEATKAYTEQIHNLSIKINQMKNTESKNNPNEKLLNDQQYRDCKRGIQFVRKNLQKIADRYQQLMVLTSSSTKGKFYINLMLLFLGGKKLEDIQRVLNQVPTYNPNFQGIGFQKLQKKNTKQS